MKLLIDVGNSRVKWAVHDGLQWREDGICSHDDIMALAERWRPYNTISLVYAANVASKVVEDLIEKVSPIPVNWVLPERRYGDIINHYHNLAELGPDRWLAVLAARKREKNDVVVVSAGTALTVDCLTRDGDYLGGTILPGHALMLTGLANGTARLDQLVGSIVDFPRSTAEAMASGVMDGLVGAVERSRVRLARHTGRELPRVVLTGGGASSMAEHLAEPVDIVDNLVIEGLLRVATEL